MMKELFHSKAIESVIVEKMNNLMFIWRMEVNP
jgi:hypothetical protein